MKKIFLLPLSFVLLAACAPQVLVPTRRSPAATGSSAAQPEASSVPDEEIRKVLFYLVHSEGDAQKIIAALDAHPNFRPTLIFPPAYFTQESNAPSIEAFRVHQTSGQIEIALTLDNNPMLPMIADLSSAGPDAAAWDVDFAWPLDVGGQIARGSGMYQKNWNQSPAGFYPPYGALSPAVAKVLERFRFDWVLAAPGARSGAVYVGSTPLLVPAAVSTSDEIINSTHTLVFMDASIWDNPTEEASFLERLGRRHIEWQTASEWAGRIGGRDILPDDANVYTKNYADWTVSDKQRLAWRALADARKVIETSQNSGRANLKRLDAAMEEMYSAESGDFLLALGQSKFVSTVSERSFLATLANVYRLAGVDVPSGLSVWFTNSRWKKSVSRSADSDVPFYSESSNRITWNDARNDDNGAGSITYPLGKYAPGCFDLQTLSVDWTDNNVTFTISLGGWATIEKNLVLPLVDVYIDVNRLTGAGSTDMLRGRRGVSIQKDAAWEYALAVAPTGATLFQSIPGKPPRTIQDVDVRGDAGSKTMKVTLPRSALRGTPRQWRLTVVLMGADTDKIGQEFVPVPVLSAAGEKSFGGATAGMAPSVIDVLTSSSEDQRQSLGSEGSRGALPTVEAQ